MDDLPPRQGVRTRQERWEHHMYGLCSLDNQLNVEMEMASHRSSVLNRLVQQTDRVKDLWLEFQRKSDNGCVLEDTAVQMAIEQHGLQSPNFHQPQSEHEKIASPPPSKPPAVDCDDVFNQAVSAAIVANGLTTTSQQDNYM